MNPAPESTCFLNGDFVPLSSARISVLDRGFIFGDGIYEVIPVFNGRAFRLSQHLERLANCLQQVMIESPYSSTRMQDICERLIDINGRGNQTLYVQLTRGVAPRNHVLAEKVTPTVFAMSAPLPVNERPTPIVAVTTEDLRWQRCDIKSTSLLANVLAREIAARAGADEAILIRDDWVTEGAASNVFVVVDGIIRTPPLGPYLLPGVTRNLLVELLRASELEVREAAISSAELLAAEEIWITSSSRELVPIGEIDGVPVGDGRAGRMYNAVRDIYNAYKESF